MTTSAWDERAEAYRVSATHASGVDLDLLVELCERSEERRVGKECA